MNKLKHHMDSSLSIPEVFVYLVKLCYLSPKCLLVCLWSEVSVFADSFRNALICTFLKVRDFHSLTSLVYLQAFQECINIIVVSATTF